MISSSLSATERRYAWLCGTRLADGVAPRAWFVIAEHLRIDGIERLLANVDFTWDTCRPIPSNREEGDRDHRSRPSPSSYAFRQRTPGLLALMNTFKPEPEGLISV